MVDLNFPFTFIEIEILLQNLFVPNSQIRLSSNPPNTMTTSVLSACDLNEQKLPKFVLIRENRGADGSFLITSIISQCLRYPKNGVVLLCLHHVSQHYISSSVRLGFNLNMAKDKGRIVMIEPLADIGTNLLKSTFVNDPKNFVLAGLLNEIKEKVNQQMETKNNVTIILDSLTTFLDLGFGKKLLLRFCFSLIEMSNDRLSVVLKMNVSDLFDDVVSSIDDYADASITLSKLKSGEFQEVDGQIDYKKRSEHCKHSTTSFLYKVGDKNVKIFQPGELAARQ